MNFQTKVYVGNLPENSSVEDFRSLFEKHGKIVECDIVKNYGFVHFAEGEDAKAAVDAINDTKWNGISLKVELSHSKVRHKPGMGNKSLCYRCGKSGHWSKDCPKGPSRGPSWNKSTQTKVYVGNLPEDCKIEAFRSLFEKHGKVVECDIVRNYGFVHFADAEDAELAVDMLNDTKWDGVTIKVKMSESKVRNKPGMGNKRVCYVCGIPGHWSKDCPRRPNQGPSFDNGNDFDDRGPFSFGNRDPYMNGGSSRNGGGFMPSGSSRNGGGFMPSGTYDGPNGYRNDSFRDSYREPLPPPPSSSSYYERNNGNAYNGNNGTPYHDSGRRPSNNMMPGRDMDRDHSRNDPYYDSYPPPPPPPTRYRPYPNAYERRAPLPPVPGSMKPPIPSLLPSSHYHHRNNNNDHFHNAPPTNHSSSNHDPDPYARPPPEYYEQQRGSLFRMPGRRDGWRE